MDDENDNAPEDDYAAAETAAAVPTRESAPDERGRRYPVKPGDAPGEAERLATANPQPRYPSLSDGQYVLPEARTQANIRDGVMYDAGSGRPVSSIGDLQQAEQFGAQLPMTQREFQRLSQLEQSYGDVLRNPNIPPKAKASLLLQMAREIHFGQSRMQLQQRQQRLEAMQSRGEAAQEAVGHQMATHGLTAESMWSNRKEVPGGVVLVDPSGKPHFVKTAEVKPFSFSQARKEAEDEMQTTRPELFEQRDPEHFDKEIPPSEQDAWKRKYGKPGDTDEAQHDAAAKGWAKEAETKRKAALEAVVRGRVHEMRQAHGQPQGSAAGPGPAGGRPAPPDSAAGSAAAPSGAAAGGGAPASAPDPVQQTGELLRSHKETIDQFQKIEDPAERNYKTEAARSLTSILHRTLGRRVTPAEAAEIQRLKVAIASEWGGKRSSRPASAHETNSDNANQFAGGT